MKRVEDWPTPSTSGLTDEQIEAAAKAMLERDACPIGIEHYRMLARAAARFLQMPWEMPTPEEVRQYERPRLDEPAKLRMGNDCLPSFRLRHEALCEFIKYRNASLIPKPVDPRREKLKRVLIADHARSHEDFVDAILASLDAKE